MNDDERFDEPCGSQFETLWTDFLEGELSPDGMAELQAMLQAEPHLRAKAGDLLQTHRLLSFALQESPTSGDVFVRRTLDELPQSDAQFRSAVLDRVRLAAPVTVPARRWSRNSVAAVAAGLLLGIVCTTVVFAYVAPSQTKVRTLLHDSFESAAAPRVTGVPSELEQWSGDYTEVVAAEQGVKPASGDKMLRFLRGDYEGRSLPESHGSDVFRLIDVRSLRREFAAGDGVVQLTALFNAASFPDEAAFECTLTIFAVDASIVTHERLKIEGTLSADSLAYSRSSRLALDRNPATWQKVSNELRLPPNTDFLMIRIGVSDVPRRKGETSAGFNGQYVDRVQLVIARRPEIAVP